MRHFIHTLRSASGIALFLFMFILMTPFLAVSNLVTAGRATNFYAEKVVPLLIRPVFWIVGLRFNRIDHAELPPGQAIYIFNHNSTLDILTVLSLAIPGARYVAKWELQYNPVFFIVGRLTGQIFIRRQRSKKAVQTLHNAYARIHRDRLSIVMAPEGTRKHEGKVGPFKKGPFRMALDLDLPIVPVFFEGIRELSRGGSLIAKPGACTAHVFPAMDTSGWTAADLDIEIDRIRAFYISCEDDLQRTLDMQIKKNGMTQ
jgi:1-acyl-sn-glycerol-3-phosphate acyltransferase